MFSAPKTTSTTAATADVKSTTKQTATATPAKKNLSVKQQLELKLREHADKGDAKELQKLLDSTQFTEEKCDPNSAGEASLQTALHRAALKGHDAIITILLNPKYKPDVTLQSLTGETAREMAASAQMTKAEEALSRYETKHYPKEHYNEETVMSLIAANLEIFKKFMKKYHINPNYKINGHTLIANFLANEHADKALFCLTDCHGNINSRSGGQNNTFMHSHIINNTNVVMRLAQLAVSLDGYRKLNPNLKDANGRTILMLAIGMGNNHLVAFLLKNSVILNLNVDLQDNDGYTALHYASLFRNYLATQLLLQAGAKLLSSKQQLTPQHLLDEKNQGESLRVATCLSLNLDRDSKSSNDIIEPPFATPILKKSTIDLLKNWSSAVELAYLLMDGNNELATHTIPATKANVELCLQQPQHYYVLVIATRQLLLLSDPKSATQRQHLEKLLKEFSGKSLREIMLSAERTSPLQKLFATHAAAALSAKNMFTATAASAVATSQPQLGNAVNHTP